MNALPPSSAPPGPASPGREPLHELNNLLGVSLQSAQNLRRRLLDPALPANQRAAQDAGLDLDALQRYLHARGLPGFIDALQDAGERAAALVAELRAGHHPPPAGDGA